MNTTNIGSTKTMPPECHSNCSNNKGFYCKKTPWLSADSNIPWEARTEQVQEWLCVELNTAFLLNVQVCSATEPGTAGCAGMTRLLEESLLRIVRIIFQTLIQLVQYFFLSSYLLKEVFETFVPLSGSMFPVAFLQHCEISESLARWN